MTVSSSAPRIPRTIKQIDFCKLIFVYSFFAFTMAWGAAAKSCDALLKRVENNDPTLCELIILPIRTFGGAEVERLARALANNTYLKSLSASGHAIPPSSLKCLGEAIAASDTFKRLAIGDKDMGDAGIVALFGSGCGKLEVIDLAYKNISLEGMKVLGTMCGRSCHLVELNISRNEFGNEGLEAFCTAAFITLDLSNLRTLILSECKIGAVGTEALASLLVKTRCATLSLSSNPLGPTASPSLTKLVHGGDLGSFHIASCNLGDTGVANLCESVRGKKNSGITLLDLSDNAIGEKGAKELAFSLWYQGENCWEGLSELKLANNPIGSSGMSSIAESLSKSRVLESLDATCTACGVDGTMSLLGGVGLKRLRLFNNKLGSAGFNSISGLLPSCGLLELDLGGNDAEPDSVKTLLEPLLTTEPITLRVLEIGGNSISDEVEELVQRIKLIHPELDIARDKVKGSTSES